MTKLNPGLKVKQPLWLTFKNSKLVLKVFEKYFFKKGQRRKPKVCETCNNVEYKVLTKLLVRQMNIIEDLSHSLYKAETMLENEIKASNMLREVIAVTDGGVPNEKH